jgi:hypothetical protein
MHRLRSALCRSGTTGSKRQPTGEHDSMRPLDQSSPDNVLLLDKKSHSWVSRGLEANQSYWIPRCLQVLGKRFAHECCLLFWVSNHVPFTMLNRVAVHGLLLAWFVCPTFLFQRADKSRNCVKKCKYLFFYCSWYFISKGRETNASYYKNLRLSRALEFSPLGLR